MSCPLPSHSDHESNFLKFLGEINDNNGSSQQESETFLIGKNNGFHEERSCQFFHKGPSINDVTHLGERGNLLKGDVTP